VSKSSAPRIGQEALVNLERAKDLRRRGMEREAETLLETLIDKEESEAGEMGVEHWYYEHLAVLHHERGDHDAEIRVLERYANQRHSSEKMAAMMAERLAAARSGASAE
jgi:hypothetical protein